MRIMGRQNWRATSTLTNPPIPRSCSPYTLPTGLVIPLGESSITTLSSPVTVTPACFTVLPTSTHAVDDDAKSIPASELRDPFYASTIPMAYSIAATSTLAYVLLALLFLPNPPHSRPWLQKVATLTVCICLTIAFVETTDVLHREYNMVGSSVYTNANEARTVRSHVMNGIVIRIGRVISDLFLWLAQVQTLIRLFPREREKVIIKWAGFGLIVLDTLFSILQSFVSPSAQSGTFLDAIPALSYLFQIALSLLYALCVLFYSFSKRRYSYFYPSRPFSPRAPGTKHYGGRSIILIALLSIASVITPIIFFIVDIAQKDLAGWGDYIRWVGAASASVVVWEWVDRIEGLEREEGKGGVLGREIYEEDDEHRYTSHRDTTNPPGEPRPRPRPRPRPPRTDNSDESMNRPPISSAQTVITSTSSTSYAVNVRQLTNTPLQTASTVSATVASTDSSSSNDPRSPTAPPSTAPPPIAPPPTTPLPTTPPPPTPPHTAIEKGKQSASRRKYTPNKVASANFNKSQGMSVIVIPPPPRGTSGNIAHVQALRHDNSFTGTAQQTPLPESRNSASISSSVSSNETEYFVNERQFSSSHSPSWSSHYTYWPNSNTNSQSNNSLHPQMERTYEMDDNYSFDDEDLYRMPTPVEPRSPSIFHRFAELELESESRPASSASSLPPQRPVSQWSGENMSKESPPWSLWEVPKDDRAQGRAIGEPSSWPVTTVPAPTRKKSKSNSL